MNDEALSPLVGLALILASVISVIAIYQTQTVPALLKEQEWEHYSLVKEKFESLAERSELASKSGAFVLVNFPLQLKYEGVSFVPLSPSAGCVVEAEKVGWVNVTYGKSTFSFDLVALKLVPKYNYLKVDEEIFVLGRYFASSGQLLKGSSEKKLILLDAGFDEISGDERLKLKVLPIIGSPTGKVVVRVVSDEKWLLDYLREEFDAVDVEENAVEFNSTSIELIVATSESAKIELEGGRLSVDDMVFNISLLSGGVTLGEGDEDEEETSSQSVENGGEVKISFESDSYVSSVTIYVTGYTSYFNEEVNVSINYKTKKEFENHEHHRNHHSHQNKNKGKEFEEFVYRMNFTWSTLSNGYLQLPIEVPRKFGDEEVEEIIVAFEFPSEQGTEVFSFKIEVDD